MNKYIKEAQESNSKRFLPETFEDYCNLHPSQASIIPMSHIQKLRDEHSKKNAKISNLLTNDTSFVNKDIKWD